MDPDRGRDKCPPDGNGDSVSEEEKEENNSAAVREAGKSDEEGKSLSSWLLELR